MATDRGIDLTLERNALLAAPAGGTSRYVRINRDGRPRNSFKLGQIGVTCRGKKINIAPATEHTRRSASADAFIGSSTNRVSRQINHALVEAIGKPGPIRVPRVR